MRFFRYGWKVVDIQSGRVYYRHLTKSEAILFASKMNDECSSARYYVPTRKIVII